MKATKDVLPNELLRRAREGRGLSQKELAEAIGLPDVKTVSRWERGVLRPHPRYRRSLCELFGMNAQELGFLSDDVALPPTRSIWNIPHRNPVFVGREDALAHLHTLLTSSEEGAQTLPLAISGLGGVGKTTLAIEYAHRFRQEYQAVLWVRADSAALLASDVAGLAAVLGLSERGLHEQSAAIAAVKQWLSARDRWLLIFDNVESLSLASEYFPSSCQGHILLTTRTQATGAVAQRLQLDVLGTEESIELLLRRAPRFEQLSDAEHAAAATLAHLLGGLPLALTQAGAYIEATGGTFSSYLGHFNQQALRLLDWRGADSVDYQRPVAAAFALVFEKIEREDHAVADLLRLYAFLPSDAIPEAFIVDAAVESGATLDPIASDPYKFDAALTTLRRHSLIQRDVEAKTLAIHPLVQTVLRDRMDEETQRQWAERVVRMINSVFSFDGSAPSPKNQRYLPLAQHAAALITQWDMHFPEAVQLLDKLGWYWYGCEFYAVAEPLLQRVLTLRERTLGPEHPAVAQSLTLLAEMYLALPHPPRYAQAQQLLTRALNINERTLGPEHPMVLRNLFGLVEVNLAQAKHARAEEWLRRALEISNREPLSGADQEAPLAERYERLLKNVYWANEKAALDTLAQDVRDSQAEDPFEHTVVNDSDEAIAYEGEWQLQRGRGLGDYQDDVHFAQSPGASLTYTFIGTGIALLAEVDPANGGARVYLDGVYAYRIDTASGVDRRSQAIVFSTMALERRAHTLKVVVEGPFAFDALSVYR